MIAEANMERCMIWDLSQLLVETVAVRSLKLTGVGKEVTFFLSLQLALQLFTVWAFKSLSLSFSLCLFTLRLRAPELLGKDTYIYIHSHRHTKDIHTNSSWAPLLIVVLRLHLPPSAVEIAWLLMAGNGFDPTPSGWLLKNISQYNVVKLHLYVLSFLLYIWTHLEQFFQF